MGPWFVVERSGLLSCGPGLPKGHLEVDQVAGSKRLRLKTWHAKPVSVHVRVQGIGFE